MHSPQYQSVPLAQINLHNDVFRITTRDDVDDLVASIPHAGLISPPLLTKQKSEYAIVGGFRRVAACRELEWNEVVARILRPELDNLDCLRLAIADNALQRPLNLIETSRALQKLSSFFANLKQLAETASTCGLPANHSIIEKVKDLCLMPQPIQDGVLKDTLSLTMANELAALEPDTAVDLALLFDQLKLSLNKQKEMVTLINEIARRDDILMSQVMAHESFQQIVGDKNSDRGQKTRYLRAFLRQWRYPRIVQAQKDFERHEKKLKLGPDIKLIPPKEFEGNAYTLKLNFSSLAHLKALLSRLENIILNSSFEYILDCKNPHSD